MRFLLEYVKLGNIKNLGESELSKLIETNLDKYSPTDANDLIMTWCEKHFGNRWNNIETMYPLLKADIEENGVSEINNKDNNLWKFLDTFNAAKLTPSQAGILYNCLTADKGDSSYLDASYSLTKKPIAYRSDKMLQTLIFLGNRRNIKRFGLASDDKEVEQLIADVLNTKNDKELQSLINSRQTNYISSFADRLLDDPRASKYFVKSSEENSIDWNELKTYLLKVADSMDSESIDSDYGYRLNIVLSAIESDKDELNKQLNIIDNIVMDDDTSTVKTAKDYIKKLVNSVKVK